jgi:glycosyltransferase involved in cell wall biosynthesis
MARLQPRQPALPPATRVVIDVRPWQEPERTPLTAEYLSRLMAAFAAEPLAGESFVLLTRALRADPTVELEHEGLPVAGRRVLPPTSRVFRSAGLTLDSFLLRAAELGSAARQPRAPAASSDAPPAAGPSGSVFHTAGGAAPLASGLPVVATLLDVAAWELPDIYLASPAARFGHRLRRRVLHDAARVIVCSNAIAELARRRLHLPRERVAVVPLAIDDAFSRAGRSAAAQRRVRQRLELPDRYLVFSGRYDARKDMPTLLAALHALAAPEAANTPRLVFAGPFDTPAERATLAATIGRSPAAGQASLAPQLSLAERAALIGGALGFVYPALSEATGVPALEALSLGVPVIASRVGVLPETVGSAGLIVEPRDARRLAAAIGELWSGGQLAAQLAAAARARAEGPARSWRDVAYDTRRVYAAAASRSLERPR